MKGFQSVVQVITVESSDKFNQMYEFTFYLPVFREDKYQISDPVPATIVN